MDVTNNLISGLNQSKKQISGKSELVKEDKKVQDPNSILIDSVNLHGKKNSSFQAIKKVEFQVLFRLDPKTAVNQQKLAQIYKKANSSETQEKGKNDYYSPEKTADRIFNFATSFYSKSSSDSPEEAEKKLVFLEKIRNAIDQGFKEARGMLGNLPDDVSNRIDQTYNLLQEKLNSWEKGESKGYDEKLLKMTDNVIENQDKDSDGVLNQEESGLLKEEFVAMDKNKDGLVTADELMEAFKSQDADRNLELDNFDDKYVRFRDAMRNSEKPDPEKS